LSPELQSHSKTALYIAAV